MVALLFSSSPFMAQSLPQSEETKFISGILDPFGMSAFFNQTAHWTVNQRNFEIIGFDGVFIWNRLGILLISLILLFFAFKNFSFFTFFFLFKKNRNSKSRHRDLNASCTHAY